MTQDKINQAASCGQTELALTTVNGEPVTVVLRAIKYSETNHFIDLAAEDEHKALRFVTDVDPDTLSDESYDALVEANMALNFTRARQRMLKKLARAEKTGVGVREIAAATASLFQRFMPPSAGDTDSPASKSALSPTPG